MVTYARVYRNHLCALPYPIVPVVKPTIVTPNSLKDILTMRLNPERVVACSVLHIQHISVASGMSLPACPHTLGCTGLSTGQWRWLKYEISCHIHHFNILQYSMKLASCQAIYARIYNFLCVLYYYPKVLYTKGLHTSPGRQPLNP